MAVVSKSEFKRKFPDGTYVKKCTDSTPEMYKFYNATFKKDRLKHKILVGDYGRIRNKFVDEIGNMIASGRTVDLPYRLGKISACYYNPLKKFIVHGEGEKKPRDVYEWWKMKHIFYDSYLHLYFVLIPMKTLTRKISKAFIENPKNFILNDL
tara:strand:- start:825 stop:1283 length:459 start_codon:yes stop_codon:yes gene_type:complete